MTKDLDSHLLQRIAEALERLAPPFPASADLARFEAFVWRSSPPGLDAVARS